MYTKKTGLTDPTKRSGRSNLDTLTLLREVDGAILIIDSADSCTLLFVDKVVRYGLSTLLILDTPRRHAGVSLSRPHLEHVGGMALMCHDSLYRTSKADR